MSDLKILPIPQILAEMPPGIAYKAEGCLKGVMEHSAEWAKLFWPSLWMYCDHDSCNDHTYWDTEAGSIDLGVMSRPSSSQRMFVSFRCRHCRASEKIYALMFNRPAGTKDLIFAKLGELPQFGPHVTEKLKDLTGAARNYFFKGRRAEALGLGIAAFAYYRRVVESQKNKILDEIIKAAKAVGSSADLIATLEKTKAEDQFSKAIREINPAVPESLYVHGQNPLTLLHSALSEGLHNDDDEECLALAQAIRVVLADLTERVGSAIAEKKEIAAAVTLLMQKNSAKKATVPAPEPPTKE